MYNLNNKQIKYLIATILSIGLFAIVIKTMQSDIDYKKLIQEAVLSDNIEATRFLIKQEADVNYKYAYNHTLLHSAALYGDIKMVKLLVNSGAKLYKNDFGLSAIDSAKDFNHSDVVKFLIGNYGDLDTINK
jgi:ankyrin repeat protein